MNQIPTAPDLAYGNPLLHALASSALLPSSQLRQLATRYASWARDESPNAAQQLAARLVSMNVLTTFQVEQLLAGRGRFLRLGQYRILEPIGAGGMGQVFKAEHQLMQRVVALKLLNRQSGDGATASFLREIRAAGRLHHPNVVTAFDADVHDGQLYLVMEYVPGVDLGRLVARGGPLPVVLACEYIRQAALGLQAAFDQDLLHRDIKPSNLLVHNHHYPDVWPPRSPAVVKLLDLGLACLTQDSNPGALAGTPEYMAPERARDSQLLDIRSDLYSLGCTFFYLLTGRTPFRGNSWTDTLISHQEDPIPSPSDIRPEVPIEVCAKVMRLLAKDRADRWATPGEVASELETWLNDYAPVLLGTADDSPADSVAPTVHDLLMATPRDSLTQRQPLSLGSSWKPVVIVVSLLALLAIGFHWLPRRVPIENEAPLPSQVAPVVQEGPRIAGRSERYRSIAQAIEAARDGDTIEIPAGQTLVSPPLTWTGKALTLRGDNSNRPRLLLQASHAVEFWEALLSCDSALSLEGIELGHEPGEQRATAHLLNVSGSRLTLKHCRLLAPESTAVVACRHGGSVEIDDCEFKANATAVSVELTPAASAQVVIRNSRLTIHDPNATALAVWASSTSARAPLRVSLENCDFDTGRVLGLTAVPGAIEVTAERNRFRCRQSLLSLAAWPVKEPWQPRLRWHGKNNTYDDTSHRLLIDGVLTESAFDDGPRS